MVQKRGQKGMPRAREKVAQGSASSQASDASMDDVFENYIELLFEKRPATRVHGLEGLVSLLCSSVCSDECMAREETLTRLFLQRVLRGKGKEPLLGARGLGLLIITLGLEDCGERIWSSTKEGLLKAANSSKADVACGAIEAFATGCFVVEEDMVEVEECMTNLKALWKKGNAHIQEKAIRAWTLLLSSLPNNAHLDSTVGEATGVLRNFLDEKDVAVRAAAGEALALLHNLGVAEDDMTEDSSDSMSIASSSTCFTRSSAMEEVVDKMKDLSQGRGDRRKSKRDRAAQRAAFRGFYNFVEDGFLQETKIKLRHGDILVIDELGQLIQLNFIRAMLSDGFQTHIQGNELLHQIFNYSPRASAPDRLNKLEKRMHKSPCSMTNKMRSQGREAERNRKGEWLAGGEVGFL